MIDYLFKFLLRHSQIDMLAQCSYIKRAPFPHFLIHKRLDPHISFVVSSVMGLRHFDRDKNCSRWHLHATCIIIIIAMPTQRNNPCPIVRTIYIIYPHMCAVEILLICICTIYILMCAFLLAFHRSRHPRLSFPIFKKRVIPLWYWLIFCV